MIGANTNGMNNIGFITIGLPKITGSLIWKKPGTALMRPILLRCAERLKDMTPEGHEAVIHVSLTDDHPWAQAYVVIEARPLT